MYWEEWLTELISEFRKKSSMLPRNQKQQISNLDNLEFPCQVDVLWVKNERLGSHYQVLFITHFEDEPDMSFNLYETSEPYRFHEISTKMLESPKWQKRLPKTEANRFIGKMYGYQTYQDYMVGALSNQYTMMKQYFNHLSLGNPVESKARTTGKQALFNELGSSVWEVRSDLTTTDPKEVADDIFKSLKPHHKNNKLPQKKATKVNPEKQLQGYGALLLPRIWIGKLPEQSLKDRIEMNLVIAKTVFNKNYKQSVVVLRQDGFIGVVFKSEIPENRAISISIELLNEIIATCMITNLPFHTIREPDLVKIRCEPETLNISGMSWRSNDYIYPLLQQQDVWGSIQPSAIYYERRIIRRTAIPKCIFRSKPATIPDEIGHPAGANRPPLPGRQGDRVGSGAG